MKQGNRFKQFALLAGRLLAWPFPGPRTAVLAFAFSLIELLLLALHGKSYWSNDGIGVAAQLGLAGLVVVWWNVALRFCRGYFHFSDYFVGLIRMQLPRAALQIAFLIPVAVGTALYMSSWLYFWRLDIFPDADALHFAALNAKMLAKYFWQSERAAWSIYLTALAALAAVSFLGSNHLWKWCVDRRKQGQESVLKRFAILFVICNVVFLSADKSSITGTSAQVTLGSVEATNRPWAPASFEIGYHVNPAMTLFCSVVRQRNADVFGEIPADALTPLGRIRPSDFPEIKPENRRNVILITIESLRSDAILAEHQGQQVMPHVAELAHSGYFFPNCYANSAQSDYCDPCILSSLYPLRTVGTHFNRGDDPWPKVLIYDVLKQYGYATAIFSSQNEAWSNMYLFYESPHLDTFFDSRAYDGPTNDDHGGFRFWMSETGLAGKMDDAVTTDLALKWVDSVRLQNKPFFIALNLQTSHYPYHRPDSVNGPFTPSTNGVNGSAINYDKNTVPIVRNAYFNALHYIDEQVGRMVSYLKDCGQANNTLIIVTGDHGEAFYETDFVGHGRWPCETSIRTGLVVHSPDISQPRIDTYLIQQLDIVPTALSTLGLPVHPAFQGMNVLDEHRAPVNERLVFIHVCTPASGDIDCVVSGTGWKYTYILQSETATLQYRPTDLTYEPNDTADEPEVVVALHNLLRQWRERQLTYYGQSKYFTWFWPPACPAATPSTLQLLTQHGTQLKSR